MIQAVNVGILFCRMVNLGNHKDALFTDEKDFGVAVKYMENIGKNYSVLAWLLQNFA